MNYAHKVHISPSRSQTETLDFWLRRCKLLYNSALEQKLEHYRKTGQFLSAYTQAKELPDIKQSDTSWAHVPNKPLKEALTRLDNSFSKFFKQPGTGFPQFKNNDNFCSLHFVKTDVKVRDNHLFLPKIKTTIKLSETVKPDYTSVVVKKDGHHWYVVFKYDDGQELVYNKETDLKLNSMGIDLGLINILTDSKGNKLKRFSVKLLKKYVQRILELNQSLSRCKKGSKNRRKVKQQLRKAYSRLRDTRDDEYNKQICQYVKRLVSEGVEIIALGDIKVKSIQNKDNKKSKRSLRRSFQNTGVGKFKDKLSNKCERRGIKVSKVKENYTSKACSSCCFANQKLRLTDRVYFCTECKLTIDRDENSAINMEVVRQGQFRPWGVDSSGKKFYLILGGE